MAVVDETCRTRLPRLGLSGLKLVGHAPQPVIRDLRAKQRKLLRLLTGRVGEHLPMKRIEIGDEARVVSAPTDQRRNGAIGRRFFAPSLGHDVGGRSGQLVEDRVDDLPLGALVPVEQVDEGRERPASVSAVG